MAAHADEYGLDAGTGNLAGLFAEEGIRMAGVDQSNEMLKPSCRSKFPLVEKRLGNLMSIPYMDGTFDFVVSSYALHHLTGEQKIYALSEMQRTLKPHGRICIVDLMVDVAELLEAGEKVSAPGKEESELPVYCAERSRMLDWFDRHGYFGFLAYYRATASRQRHGCKS
ncbi:class I SAM-dependent methyltransferase [Paenibacillus terrae]|uniref:class I SAM-dependent methyltransferase n=1 Tax=Paenibacillus terrae TaxID=159743 RepID=UPI0021CD15F9|nr:class I SAM-dependent methyltransferase [Paenibacillus terrae]